MPASKKETDAALAATAAFLNSPGGRMLIDVLTARIIDRVTAGTMSGVEGAHNRIDEIEKLLLEKFPDGK
jgi:hypothetical protein